MNGWKKMAGFCLDRRACIARYASEGIPLDHVEAKGLWPLETNYFQKHRHPMDVEIAVYPDNCLP
jgi:hypothetical protein